MHKKSEVTLFVLLMLVLVPLELLCGRLARETLGEIISAVYYLLIVALNLVCVLLAVRWRVAAAICAVALALAIVPYQLVLADRLLRVQAEAASIVTYAYEQKLSAGAFPLDLSQYAYRDAAMRPFIQEYRRSEAGDSFSLSYRVGAESTSHSYSPAAGWGYYPD